MTASEADAAARNAAARTADPLQRRADEIYAADRAEDANRLGASHAYDPAARRQSVRRGRERGCWVYIPAVELRAAGMPVDDSRPWYRTWGRHSRGAHSVVVGLYREP